MNATKSDIVSAISKNMNCSLQVAGQFFEQSLEQILRTLHENGRLELRNFGVWEIKTRRARTALNPRTGEKIQTKEKKVVTFTAGKYVNELINEEAEY